MKADKYINEFFNGKVKEDLDKDRLRVIIGESPYYIPSKEEGTRKEKKRKGTISDEVVKSSDYPTGIVAFFRSDWSYNPSFIAVLNLLMGIENGYDFIKNMKKIMWIPLK